MCVAELFLVHMGVMQYGKSYEELDPAQRRRVGSILGGEHSKEGGYTETVHVKDKEKS